MNTPYELLCNVIYAKGLELGDWYLAIDHIDPRSKSFTEAQETIERLQRELISLRDMHNDMLRRTQETL